ncbi:DUF3310 domain-containing protein [Staphylococcus caeli]|uniref:DUF3310 domain-containing protein n=1 Tax=Staphylococcus caeli TaxID=2201815 RepID=UPI003F55FC27
MKIRDLELDQYVIVYDIGKSEFSEGMTVVGRVDELEFRGDDDNTAIINSIGNLYEITDDNYFDLWSNYLKNKTESVNGMRIKDLNVGDTIKIPNGKIPLEGKVVGVTNKLATVHFPSVGYEYIGDETTFIRVREASKPLDPTKWLEKAAKENIEKAKSILESGLGISKSTTEYNKSNDLQQRKRNDTVNHPSHYNYGDIEVIDFIEQVTQHYNPNVAYHIGNAIKYLARSPHKNGKEDVEKARWYIERAYENWDVK